MSEILLDIQSSISFTRRHNTLTSKKVAPFGDGKISVQTKSVSQGKGKGKVSTANSTNTL